MLEPVLLAGTTVARASLHNADEMARLDVRRGDWVFIEKSGEIIPQVIKVIEERRTGSETEFVFPAACPACASQDLEKLISQFKASSESTRQSALAAGKRQA